MKCQNDTKILIYRLYQIISIRMIGAEGVPAAIALQVKLFHNAILNWPLIFLLTLFSCFTSVVFTSSGHSQYFKARNSTLSA